MLELLQGCVIPLFFPGIFMAWDTGFVLPATQCWEQREQENPPGNISEEGKKEFWEFPPDGSFLGQILLPWLWSQGTLVWVEKRHIQPGNDISLEKFPQSLGWEGWRKEKVGNFLF